MKSVQNLRNSLKFKAEVARDALAVMVNGQPHVLLGAEARVLVGTRFAYVSAPAFSHIVELRDGSLQPLPDDCPADEIESELLPLVEKPRQVKARAQSADLPEELKDLLKSQIPDGYRIASDADGQIRLVKMRKGHKAGSNAEHGEQG
jgi:hypothetical protein